MLLGLSLFTWLRRSATSGAALPLFLAASALWVLGAAVEHSVPTIAEKILASKLQYLGILTVPITATFALLNYLDREKWSQIFLKVSLPLAGLSFFLVVTNEMHHWVWTVITLDSSGALPLLVMKHGPVFWVINSIGHGQLIAAFLLFSTYSLQNWRPSLALTYLGFAVPSIANLLYVLELSPIAHIDITPFGLIVTGILFTISFHGTGGILTATNLAYRDIVESITDLILVVDDRNWVLSANKNAREALVTKPLPAKASVLLKEHPQLLHYIEKVPDSAVQDVEIQTLTSSKTFDVRAVQTLDSPRGNHVVIYILRDVTTQRALDRELRGHREQLRQIIDLIPYPIYARDAHGRFLLANEGCAKYYDRPSEEIVGRTVMELHKDQQQADIIREKDANVTTSRKAVIEETSFALIGQSPRIFRTTVIPFDYDETEPLGIVAVSVDVTLERERETLLKVLASTDPLTNLPNRRNFQKILQSALARAARSSQQIALLSLDLDHFKMVNDNYGHPTGDEVLRQVADRLRENLRFGDRIGGSQAVPDQIVISRQGGDEFMILLPTITEPADAARVAIRLISALSEPFEVGPHQLQLGASIGIAIGPDDGATPEGLIRLSDQALNNVKKMLRGRFEFHNAELSAKVERRHQLEQGLRRALDRGEFNVHFQPIYDTETSLLCGAEALLRWDSAELGSVSPDEFIPVADESGLVVRIGELVFQTVCKQIALWRMRGLIVPQMSVNLSARQLLDATFSEQIQRILQENSVAASDIEFELTEGSIFTESPKIDETLQWLRDEGASLALDDFGTGYSSLSHIRRFSFQRLKIDRSFVSGLGVSKDDERLVRGVIALAHRLNIQTVAEGVESQQQLDILLSEGCNYVQGYLMGRPEPVEIFERLLKSAPK